ncbi:MAG: hypothetical protein WCP97_00520 [bacterium]
MDFDFPQSGVKVTFIDKTDITGGFVAKVINLSKEGKSDAAVLRFITKIENEKGEHVDKQTWYEKIKGAGFLDDYLQFDVITEKLFKAVTDRKSEVDASIEKKLQGFGLG